MNTLTVWRFDDPEAGEAALPPLQRHARDGSIRVGEAALVSWPAGHRKPSTRDLGSLAGPGELWGGFWGMLLGLIFLTPIAGPTFGAGAGAVAATLADFGIEDDLLKRVRDVVAPGTSALFVLSDRAAADELAIKLRGSASEGLRATLSPAHERRLREALGEESQRLTGIERPLA